MQIHSVDGYRGYRSLGTVYVVVLITCIIDSLKNDIPAEIIIDLVRVCIG